MNDGLSVASIIISVIALLAALGCLTIMLAKNFFSTHNVQMVPVDPMASIQDMMTSAMAGNPMQDSYRDISDPLTAEELEYLESRKKKVNATKRENSDVV